MGLDLTLLPFDAEHETFAYSHNVLQCERRGDLFDEFFKLTAMRVPDKFTSFVGREGEGDSHYGRTVDTPYGEPLLFVEVESLLSFKDHPHVIDNYQNRAVWAYLACLEPRTKVALFWH